MLIHEVSRITGLTHSTIRYYEREGLLDDRHIQRERNNYRHYTDEAVIRLRHFKHAREVGFTIKELRQLTSAHDDHTLTPKYRRQFLEQKIEQLTDSLHALQKMQTYFKDELDKINRLR
jgi:MerR family copper efflux transcriptional regulator